MEKICIWGSVLMALAACTPKQNTISTVNDNKGATSEIAPSVVAEPVALNEPPASMVLKASAFRMSGDFADNVAVTVGDDGRLTYYPAPSDISASSKPVAIADGWYLNRQGLGPNSVFTKWTFDEYMRLPSTPSPEEIKDAIVRGAEVTDFRILPVPASEASGMTPAELRALLR